MSHTSSFSQTERAYGGRVAWQHETDTGRTQLNYDQWVVARMPEFKAEFGDWQSLREIAAMRQTLVDWTSNAASDIEWAKGKTVPECEIKPEDVSVAINPVTGEPLPEVIDAFRFSHNKETSKMDDGRARFQAAWHGSSHEFDAFSLDHVGQGGVPAHGWGLYFARDRATAESYRRPFAHDAAYLWDGDHIQVDGYSWVSTLDGERYDRDTPRGYALWALSEAGGNQDDALFNLEKELESIYEDAADAALDEIGRTEEEERAEQQWNEALESRRDARNLAAIAEMVSEIRRKSKDRPEVQARAQELPLPAAGRNAAGQGGVRQPLRHRPDARDGQGRAVV